MSPPDALPIRSVKMETEFQLIVQRGRLRFTDDCRDLQSLVRDAADYAAGEYEGTVCGALELTYKDGMLVNAVPVADLSGRVHDELQSRPEWTKRQASAARWAAE